MPRLIAWLATTPAGWLASVAIAIGLHGAAVLVRAVILTACR